MLGDRQQLDVGEPRAADVLGELMGGLAVVEMAVAVAATPGPEMHLVDRNRRVERVRGAPGRHPLAVLPAVLERPSARGCLRRHLGVEGERVGLVDLVAVPARDDVKLVAVPARDVGHEAFPDSGAVAARRERMRAPVPAVEFADHGDLPCIRRPHAEIGAAFAQLTPELLVEPPVRAFLEEIDVVVREHLASAIGMRVELWRRGAGAHVAPPCDSQVCCKRRARRQARRSIVTPRV